MAMGVTDTSQLPMGQPTTQIMMYVNNFVLVVNVRYEHISGKWLYLLSVDISLLFPHCYHFSNLILVLYTG